MKNFYKDLFQYNHDTNQKLLAHIIPHEKQLPERVLFLFSHIQNAHHIWIQRIIQEQAHYTVFQTHSLNTLQTLNETNYSETLSILNNKELNQIIDYTNSKGEKYKNTIQDILFHIINHSTYHRAQIASLFRTSEIEPIPTDYITYKR